MKSPRWRASNRAYNRDGLKEAIRHAKLSKRLHEKGKVTMGETSNREKRVIPLSLEDGKVVIDTHNTQQVKWFEEFKKKD